MTVTFFGHRDTPSNVYESLKESIKNLIENNNADNFYVGNHGNFDSMALRALQVLKREYPHIVYTVVLAYMPIGDRYEYLDSVPTLLPNGIENTPQKYAILKRNKWLVENSDTVLTYVKHSFGGALTFQNMALKKGKNVINISQKR